MVRKAEAFCADASEIFGEFETSPLRVHTVEASVRRLNGLTVPQDEMIRQALYCTARGYYRPAVVSAWSAFVDCLETLLASDGLVKLHACYQAWSRHKTLEDLREHIGEFQLIEAARELGFITKGEMNIIHGALAKRNKCAHPSAFTPGYNDTLGFCTEMIDWIEKLSLRTL